MRRPSTRELVLAGAGLVGAATAATSAVSLYGIAVKCGIPEPWAAANPIALDAGAGVAALAWITEQGERRRWGRLAAIGALVASLAENGIDHAITSNLLEVNLWLVLAVSGCIPAMLFACVHLAALMARPVVKVPVPKSRSGRVSVSSTPVPAGPTEQSQPPVQTDISRASRARELMEQGVPRSTAYRRAANGG